MKESATEQIKDRIDILDIVKDYVPGLKRAGKTYKGCCPFHHEKTPSFTVSPDKGLFYCFGCQAGGDLFEFFMKAEGLSFNEALQKLAQRAGVVLEKTENLTEDEKRRLTARKAAAFAKDFYHKTLLSAEGNEIRSYLKSRHLTKETTVKFELGATPKAQDGLVRAAIKAGYNEPLLKSLGLAGGYSKDYFRSRLIFPIFNARGEAVGFGGRIVGEGQPKYLNSPETILFSKSKVLYALNHAAAAIRKQGYALLLEGYMDVVACFQAGVENCVAPLGTAFAQSHAALLKRYTDTAVILFDPDAAGIKASLRTALILIEQGLFVKVASLGDEGLDPDEYITKYGRDKFEEVLSAATDIITFRADVLIKNGHAALAPQEKSKIAAELMEIVSRQPDPIVKSEWIKTVAEKLNIEERLLSEPRAQAAAQSVKQTPAATETAPKAETDLLAWVIKNPSCASLAEPLDAEKFENKRYFEILRAFIKLVKDKPHRDDYSALLAHERPQDESLILKMTLSEEPGAFNPARDISACVKEIEKKFIAVKLQKIKEKIKSLGAGNATEELLRLQTELQKQLKS